MVPDARVFSSMNNEQKYPWQSHFLKKIIKEISNFKCCNYCKNNMQTLGLRVYKEKLINCR
jgi:hypothetical protein